LYRDALKGAGLVATPGCHVTTAVLALHPLIHAGLVEPTGITVDTMTGITGAGRSPTNTNLFSSVDSNVEAYGLLGHRHTPEIEQELGAQVLFTPHLVPMSRGLLATCHAFPAAGADLSTERLLAVLRERWADEPFMVVTDGSPSTKATLGSNAVHVTARYDERTNRVLAIAALDNLTKGASGGAMQAANVALGLDETAGLSSIGLAP
jgi:N-acetyl-gamma-glutamyl-phosphate reductase